MNSEAYLNIDNFINNNFKNGSSIEQLNNLKLLIHFLNTNNYIINYKFNKLDLLLNNPKLTNMIKSILSLNDYSKLISDDSIYTLISLYAINNNITLDNENENLKEESSLDAYLNDLKNTSLLTKEEERELFIRYSKGDINAYNRIVESNLRLVIALAKKFVDKGLDFEDLIQEGNFGLLKAVEGFDYTKGYKFSTYACPWILQAITRAIHEKSRNIRIPVNMSIIINRINTFTKEYYSLNGYYPSKEEIIENTKISEKEYLKVMNYSDTISLNMSVGEKDETLEEYIKDEKRFENDIIDKDYYDSFDNFVFNNSILNDREKYLLKLRYGYFDGKIYTQNEIAEEFKITSERVRQLEIKALRKLRRDKRIREYAISSNSEKRLTKLINSIQRNIYVQGI